MGILTDALAILKEGLAFGLALFKARNNPAMQENARAQTLANIRASVNGHLNSGNLAQVQEDGS